jgi:uncharacterized protein (DUF58 family)
VKNLTVRGRCFLAAGVAAVICGVQVGERDFVRIGLLAVLVPVLMWLLLRRTEREVWIRRNVSDLQVEAGETAQVEVHVGNAGRRTGPLLMEEGMAPALGGNQRFVVKPLEAGGETTLRYLVRTENRGRYPLGPMHVRVPDPLGMVDLDQALASTASILVTPRTEPLPQIPLTGRWAGAGDNRTRDLLGGGSPDVTIREYRLGDDLRRIHWPTSARVDELMVRREEQQWQSRCTLLIDNRRSSHRGYGADSSMEAAVRTAASIMRNLVALDFEVRLVSATGQSSAHGWHQGARGATLPEQLERLALMTMTRDEHLSTGWIDETQHGGMLLAVLGHLGEADRGFLTGLARAGDSAYAVVLDVAEWDRATSTEEPATAALRSGGWKATTLQRSGSLAASWLELAR